MKSPAARLVSDLACWVLCIFTAGALHGLGLIEDRALALAGCALWLAIRATSKSEVNTAHQNSEED